MKKTLTPLSILLILVFVTTNTVKAQNFCGTPEDSANLEAIREYHRNKENYISPAGNGTYFIPIQFFIVGTDAGTGHFSISQLMSDLCELNERYNPANFYFYLNGPVIYLNATTYYNHTYDDGYDMMVSHNKKNCVNAYYVNDPDGNCGYYLPSGNAVAIKNACSGRGTTTLTHELGHFFSLPHPFTNVAGIPEYVDGSNCNEGGDRFCDTRADYLGMRWQCPYSGTQTDAKGHKYDPDGTLYMSYSNDGCQNRFSQQQITAMHYNLTQRRSSYIAANPIDTSDLLPINLISPLASEKTAETVTFKWSAVPGAVFYILEASAYSVFPKAKALEAVVNDTSYTATMPAGKSYYWRVKAVSPGNTCAAFATSSAAFTVEKTSSVQTLVNINFEIYPNPNPRYLRFANHNTRSIRITDLSGRILYCTQSNSELFELTNPEFAPGVYLIEIFENGSKSTKRFAIN